MANKISPSRIGVYRMYDEPPIYVPASLKDRRNKIKLDIETGVQVAFKMVIFLASFKI